jgi:hypothetical protein
MSYGNASTKVRYASPRFGMIRSSAAGPIDYGAPMSTGRTLAVIAGGIVALVVVAVAVVLIAGNRAAQTFPGGSPQAAVQAYLTAWEAEEEPATLWDFFSSDVQAEYTLEDYERAVDEYHSYSFPDGGSRHTVYIDGVEGSGDRVTVQLTVEEFYGDGLNTSSNRSPRSVRLVREDGGWKLRDPLVWLDPAPIAEPFPKES